MNARHNTSGLKASQTGMVQVGPKPSRRLDDDRDRATLEQAADAHQAGELETVEHAELMRRLSLD